MLREDGKLVTTTRFETTQKTVHPLAADAADQAREFLRRHWKFSEKDGVDCGCGVPTDFYERAQTHFLCISGMAFQDVWNVDLERLRRCCIHVVTPQKRVVPFCAYYLTSVSGQRLYSNSETSRMPLVSVTANSGR